MQQTDNESKDAAIINFTFKDDSVIPAWAKNHIDRIASEGIINGYTDGTFRPADQITRAELAVMTVRALRLETKQEAKLTFADSEQIAAWAKPYIAAAAQAGIVNGKGNNRFAPSDTATRAEAVKLVLALLESK
ncbi:S-layer homology domain-containing protein [Paenibacillus sp. IITD108]